MRRTKKATLVIRPDLEPFNYGDYSKLGEIIARGVAATQEKSAEMHALIPGKATSSAGPKNLNGSVIDAIEFEGLDRVGDQKAREIVETRPGNPTDSARLTRDMERLSASGQFEHVACMLAPAGEGHYRQKCRITASAARTLGLSLRFDQDYKFVVLGEFNMRGLFGTPSSATFSSQFGGLQSHSAGLRLVHPRFANLFLEPLVYVRRQERNDVREGNLVDTFSDRRLGAQLMLGVVVKNRFEMAGGYQIQRVTIRGGTEPVRQNSRENLAGLVLRMRYDTLDHQEFPGHGMLMNLQMTRRTKSLGSSSQHTIVQGDIQRLLPLSEKSTLAIRAGASFAKKNLPFYERAYVGGSSFSEFASRQFMGFGKDELATRQFVLLGATYRRQIFSSPSGFLRRGYLTFDYNVVGSSESRRFMEGYRYRHGAGPGFSIATPFGPIRIGTGFGAGRPKMYFSIGPSF